MLKYVSLAVFVYLCIPSIVKAVGGPVKIIDVTYKGGVFPQQENDISLVQANINIRIDDDGHHYHVEEKYQLSNPPPIQYIDFGIPFIFPSLGNENKANIKEITLVKLIVDGKTTESCTVTSFLPQRKKLVELSNGESVEVTHWCVTNIGIPAGKSTISVKYRGVMQDLAHSESEYVSGARKLFLTLDPSGFWKGNVESFTMSLDAGIYANDTRVLHPSGATQKGKDFYWERNKIDPKLLPALESVITSDSIRSQQLIAWNSMFPPKGISVKASSSLKSTKKYSYQPEQMLDGNIDTAWCEGVKSTGKNEWIEIIRSNKKQKKCRATGFTIVPGYAKSQKHWTENGRVREMELSACAKPQSTRKMIFNLKDNVDLAGDVIGFQETTGVVKADNAIFETDCWRIRLVDVQPGTKYNDTCISEIGLIVKCI